MNMRNRSGDWRLLACGLALLGGGCGPELLYLPSLAVGQFDAIVSSVPIEEAIGSGDLTEEEAGKLELILDVRQYAIETMGLADGISFTYFVDTGESSRAFNVSASDKHRFRPMTWTFPIVGTIPYLVFFDRDMADRQIDRLVEQDFDVFVYEVQAYSTLNLIPNPVRSAMLRRDNIALAEVVIHELLHDTVWTAGDTPFNESLATFVGRIGAVEYVTQRYPDSPEMVDTAMAQFEDTDRYTAFVFELYNELDAYYSSDLTSEEKVGGREAIYQAARERFFVEVHPLMNVPENYDWISDLPTNNAWMLGNYRYNLDLDLFEQVYEATGSDWRSAIDVFRSAARSGDPKGFMRDWLEGLEG